MPVAVPCVIRYPGAFDRGVEPVAIPCQALALLVNVNESKYDILRPIFGTRPAQDIEKQDFRRWLVARAAQEEWKRATMMRWAAAISLAYSQGMANNRIEKLFSLLGTVSSKFTDSISTRGLGTLDLTFDASQRAR